MPAVNAVRHPAWGVFFFDACATIEDYLPELLEIGSHPVSVHCQWLTDAHQIELLPMPDFSLRKLDGRTVAVQLAIQDQKRILKGVGRFDADGEIGPVLRVGISDPAGDFEILLKEDQWKGQIDSGEQFNCDFLLHLGSKCLSPE